MYQVLIDIQAIHHEKPTLETSEVTKLLQRDMTSSNDDLPSYAKSIKLISTTSTTHPVNNETPDLYPEGATLSKFIYAGRPTTMKPTFVALPYLISHQPFYLPRMFERYTLSTTSFPSQTFDETGCDYFLFHMPGKEDHITVDIHYSLEHHNGIHTEEVNLLEVKESNDLPSWYPLFQLPYQIDVKVTWTGLYIYVDIIYIDSSPDPDIFAPYVYSNPSDETI